MIGKNKGFSLIELIAVIFITSAIIAPLISSLIGNIEINNRSQFRRSATSIADGALNGLDKIDFSDFRAKLDTANGNNDYYIEMNLDTCSTLIDSADQTLCNQLFATIWNNLTLTSSEFKIYFFDYALTSAELSAISSNGSIEIEARNAISTDEDILAQVDGNDIANLIRVVIWLDYYDDPDQHVTIVGLIIND